MLPLSGRMRLAVLFHRTPHLVWPSPTDFAADVGHGKQGRPPALQTSIEKRRKRARKENQKLNQTRLRGSFRCLMRHRTQQGTFLLTQHKTKEESGVACLMQPSDIHFAAVWPTTHDGSARKASDNLRSFDRCRYTAAVVGDIFALGSAEGILVYHSIAPRCCCLRSAMFIPMPKRLLCVSR